ncbi:hypothetical protein HaLaN_13931 [Haematococcus lacustris]|uniref:Uncharacterized protein n=1 Tax=Haematococcus lacustris TaxID=44745 RepID=A0A699Z5E9_HAELA|nr:hypothetical protein HaLaN_13931 [Haematococcus lacustris]
MQPFGPQLLTLSKTLSNLHIKNLRVQENCARNGLRFNVRPLLTSTPHSTSRKSSASHCAMPARILAMFRFEWSGRPVNRQFSQTKTPNPGGVQPRPYMNMTQVGLTAAVQGQDWAAPHGCGAWPWRARWTRCT